MLIPTGPPHGHGYRSGDEALGSDAVALAREAHTRHLRRAVDRPRNREVREAAAAREERVPVFVRALELSERLTAFRQIVEDSFSAVSKPMLEVSKYYSLN